MSSEQIILNAWRAEVAGAQPVLVSVLSAAGYIESEMSCRVPGTVPPYQSLVPWQQQWVPLLRLTDAPFSGVLVLNLNHMPGMTRIALPLITPPRLLELDDAVCEHFDIGQCGVWSPATISGVCMEGEHLPIIDPDRLVGVAFLKRWRPDSVSA